MSTVANTGSLFCQFTTSLQPKVGLNHGLLLGKIVLMKRLWAPWRMKYFSSKQSGCIFCNLLKEGDDERNLVVWRGESAYIVLNRYPYTSGHLLVVANIHKASFEQLPATCRCEMMELATRCVTVLRKVYHPDAFNLGANIGESAGAGVPGHVHMHIVPRWTGDASFLSVIGETRVLPESLEESYKRIRNTWKE